MAKCRFCNSELTYKFIDLVNAPPSNSYISKNDLDKLETYYPLVVYVCSSCLLVQLEESKKSSEIFSNDYAYFSSYSSTWLDHCKDYTDMIINRLQLNSSSIVTEIASNDGYLLQYFNNKKINCVGIEPTLSTAEVAIEKGIRTIVDFFGERLAYLLDKSDLIIGNNVLAHVPDINDFVSGLKIVLKDNGTITLEFPHILNLINYNQFDTIYHEHYSYLSLYSVIKIFEKHKLKIYDVEELETHGGSLRIYATHFENDIQINKNVFNLLDKENKNNLNSIDGYLHFQKKAFDIKLKFLQFLINAKKENKKICGYGAAAKGNTLLNYCGIKNDLIDFIVDKSPHKQNKYLPGSHIPIVDISFLENEKPDYVIIFPWNLEKEIISDLNFIKNWGGSFVIVIPEIRII